MCTLGLWILSEITQQDIADSIAQLSNSPSSGEGGITAYIIKYARTEL